MNKFLEKIAFRIGPGHTSAMGALAGAGLGGYAGYHQKQKDVRTGFFSFKKVDKTQAERVIDGISGAVGGAYLGALGGFVAHPEVRKILKQGRGYHGHSGAGGKASNEYTSRTIHDIHADLGMPKGGFKTKSEAKSHFRKMRSQYHPDKHPGKEAEMNKKMATFNRAWDEFEKHPEGFTKLANAYLYKLAGVNWGKLAAGAKKHPIPVAGGIMGGADGLLSTTRQKNEDRHKFHLRQLRNTAKGTAAGAGAGYVAEKAIHYATTN